LQALYKFFGRGLCCAVVLLRVGVQAKRHHSRKKGQDESPKDTVLVRFHCGFMFL
jgi:hypothetical protein